jgi:hypothetical protein
MAVQKLRDLVGGGGTGDVVGPASAVDDRIATFDGTTGKLIQDGGSTIAGVLATADAAADAGDAATLATAEAYADGLVNPLPAANVAPGTDTYVLTTVAGVAAWAAPGGVGASATTVEVNLGTVGAESWRGRFTITDAAIGATSKVLVWQAPGPYTGKGTRADEAELQPVEVRCVAPAAGSAVVTWETPVAFGLSRVVPSGLRDAPSTAAGFDPRYPYQETVSKRLGKVRGNVKFSYVVFS